MSPPTSANETFTAVTARELRALIASREELALIDVRDKDDYLVNHILTALTIPVDSIEARITRVVPRRSVHVVLYDRDGCHVGLAAERLRRIGYSRVSVLSGGLVAWSTAGQALYEDTNTPSKVFGEYVEHTLKTPSVDPEELDRLRRSGQKHLLLDCRPQAEHMFGHIPGALYVPGANIVDFLIANQPDQGSKVIIHCGGRTRGIIATQSIIAARTGLDVACLRNGTMGWRLAGFELEAGLSLPAPYALPAMELSRRVADEMSHDSALAEINPQAYDAWLRESDQRTLYVFDLRDRRVECPGTSWVEFPAQLVQETDNYIGVRNARVVLLDERGTKASFVGTWLLAMGWKDTAWLRCSGDAVFAGPEYERLDPPVVTKIDAAMLQRRLSDPQVLLLDLSWSGAYIVAHIAGAVFARRQSLREHLSSRPNAVVILVSETGRTACWAASELNAHASQIFVLDGGMQAWRAGARPMDTTLSLLDETSLLNASIVGASSKVRSKLRDFVMWELERFFLADAAMPIQHAMQGYLDWEIELFERWRADPIVQFS